jgi:hypothetical protein
MSLGEGDWRLWFVVDELDALGAIDGLPDALARLRKFGGRCALGFQSMSQEGNQSSANPPRGEAGSVRFSTRRSRQSPTLLRRSEVPLYGGSGGSR